MVTRFEAKPPSRSNILVPRQCDTLRFKGNFIALKLPRHFLAVRRLPGFAVFVSRGRNDRSTRHEKFGAPVPRGPNGAETTSQRQELTCVRHGNGSASPQVSERVVCRDISGAHSCIDSEFLMSTGQELVVEGWCINSRFAAAKVQNLGSSARKNRATIISSDFAWGHRGCMEQRFAVREGV